MADLLKRVTVLRNRTGMPKLDAYRHFDIHQEVPLHVQRIICETEYAIRLSEAVPVDTAPIASALTLLEEALDTEGVITRQLAAQAEACLLPLQPAAKKYTVHMISHAHIDMNWMWPWQETVAVTLETFRTVLQLMREYPDFTFAQSQASTYRIVEEYEPKMLDEIRRRVREGRWEVTASTWVEADKNMSSCESQARHILYTKAYLSRLLGISPDSLDIDYEPDTFGHNANVPEILARGGVRYYYHCRGGNYENAIYRWQSKGGREILVYCEPTWYLGDINPTYGMLVPSFCEKYGLNDWIKVYGVGDHGGGATRQDLSWINEMMTWPIWPTLKYSTHRAFYHALEAKRDTFPVYTGELNPVFDGCYTTQAAIKRANKTGEDLLNEAEALSSAATVLTGADPGTALFRENWKKVLFSQFHDILPGSCVRSSREYALGTFQTVVAGAGTAYTAAMRAIANATDTSSIAEKGAVTWCRSEGGGAGFGSDRFRPPFCERGATLTRVFHVFNPHPDEITLPTELDLWDWPGDLRLLSARDSRGEALPLQLLSRSTETFMLHDHVRVLVQFAIPAYGMRTIILDESDEMSPALPLPGDPRKQSADLFALENEYLLALFDPTTGRLVSLTDKRSNHVVARDAGFRFVREDTDKGMPAWIIGRELSREKLSLAIRPGATGELRNSFLLSGTYGNGSKIECEVSLDRGAKHLSFRTKVDSFDFGTKDTFLPDLGFSCTPNESFTHILSDIPGGLISRVAENIDMPCLSFVTTVHSSSQPVLGADCKYGFRGDGDELSVTLIRSAFEPDPYTDRGIHEFTLFIGAAENRAAWSLSRAATAEARYVTSRPHPGTLPMDGSFVTVAGNVLLSAIKPAEDGRGLILRLVNDGGKCDASLTCCVPPRAACLTDINETDGEVCPVSGSTVTLSVPAHSVNTLRVIF